MAVLNWGDLTKSQADDETIEEAIARLIVAHNADESAHLATGQSLQSHKASDIIDHLALSIVNDKVKDGAITLEKMTATNRIIMSAFESLDGWGSAGTVIAELGSLTVKSGNTSGNKSVAYAIPSGIVGLTWDKDFIWQSTVRVAQITQSNHYFGIGASEYIGGYSGAGLKIEDGKLYCYHLDIITSVYTYVTHEITGYTLTDAHVYRIVYDQSAGELKFYIDGKLEHTFNSGLPEDDSDELGFYQVQTDENAYKFLYAFDLNVSIPK